VGYVMLVVWWFNFFLAGRRLRQLRCHWRVEGPIFAGKPFTLGLDVHNPVSRGQYGVRFASQIPDQDVSWFVLHLRAGEAMQLRQAMTLPRRGGYQLAKARVVSGYPFGLAQRSARIGSADLIVLPRLGRLHRGRLRHFLSLTAPVFGQPRSSVRPHLTSQIGFHGLRPFRNGDSPRWIHWRKSARRGELMVREFEEASTDTLVLIVEPTLCEELEEAISLAATICWEWSRQKGERFVLAIAGSRPESMDGLSGEEHAVRMLERLAMQQGDPECNLDGLVKLLTATDLPAGPVLVVSPRPSGLAEALSACLHRPVAGLDVLMLQGQSPGTNCYDPPDHR
jgi:uncharacterized protein (DUF58 family)